MIKHIVVIGVALAAIAAGVIGVVSAAADSSPAEMPDVGRMTDSSRVVMLVASAKLEGSPLERTVVVAAPLPDGGHIGFIVNRPTRVRLETLFPDDSPARNVKEPLFYGGPELTRGMFALMRAAPDPGASVVPLLPDVVAVLDPTAIDHVIATTPNAARYFVGMILWHADELERQVGGAMWNVRPADGDSVFSEEPSLLWIRLGGTTARAPTVDLTARERAP